VLAARVFSRTRRRILPPTLAAFTKPTAANSTRVLSPARLEFGYFGSLHEIIYENKCPCLWWTAGLHLGLQLNHTLFEGDFVSWLVLFHQQSKKNPNVQIDIKRNKSYKYSQQQNVLAIIPVIQVIPLQKDINCPFNFFLCPDVSPLASSLGFGTEIRCRYGFRRLVPKGGLQVLHL